jgi:hypothetical protein
MLRAETKRVIFKKAVNVCKKLQVRQNEAATNALNAMLPIGSWPITLLSSLETEPIFPRDINFITSKAERTYASSRSTL